MSSFPLFDLPFVPLLQIILHTNIKDLFMFSFISQKAKNLVKMGWKHTDRMLIFIGSADTLVVHSDENKVHLMIEEEDSETPRPGFSVVETSIGGVEVSIRHDPNNVTLAMNDTRENRTNTIFPLLDVLTDLFPCEYLRITALTDNDIEKILGDRLMLQSRELVFREQMSNDSLKSILDTHECKDLDFCGPVEEPFVYEKPIKAQRLDIWQGSWVTRSNLLSLECEDVTLYNVNLVNDDFNQFIVNWLNGAAENTGIVHIGSKHKLDLTEVLSGIDTIPGTKKRPSASKHFVNRFRYENGRDIRRKDGVLATILVERDKFFLMTVWDDPSPNMRFDHLRMEYV